MTDQKNNNENKEPSFIVKDKRKIDKEEEKIKEGPGFILKETKEERKETDLPEINFTTFVLSLASSALIYMGEMQNPQTGEKEENLALAKQNIDILNILDQKTKGNLTSDEQKLLEQLLFDLRIKYVTKRGK
jgi:hypothetical protein